LIDDRVRLIPFLPILKERKLTPGSESKIRVIGVDSRNAVCTLRSILTDHFSFAELLSVASRGLVDEMEFPPKSNVIFNCHQCGRTYQMRHNLVKHLRFECGGQKHFACSLCPSRYTQNGKLRQHMLNAHNIFVPPRKIRFEFMSANN